MRFCDLGPLQVQIGDELTIPKGRRLTSVLGTLLLHLDRRVSVDLLLDAVWGDEASTGSIGTLESHIWRLRQLLEPNRARGGAARVLINDSGGYRLVATPAQVDSARFEQLSLEVLDLLTTDQADRALVAADQALALWRGDPFLDLAARPWAVGPLARLDEIRSQLQERRIEAILGVDQPEQAISELEPLLAEHPFRERLWWQRMLALYRAGRTEDALTTYRSARRTLLDEVGLEPGPELVDLQRRILEQDPALRPAAPRVPTRPARVVELKLPRPRPLLGRGADLQQVGEMLTSSSLVTVAGAAGCGKTLLATEVARLAAPNYPDGVQFVDLSSTEPDTDVAGPVAAALDLAVPPGTSALAALVGYATDRRVLLVLDNCEQVLDQVAELAESLLGPDRQAALLTTSREPLGVPDERVHTLDPLALTEAGFDAPLAPATEPAVALFLARARLDEAQSPEDLATVREICRAVDGIPLAIELAAALATTFSLVEIADQVQRDPGQLAAIGRGQAHHHQTLTSAIERSHRLLSDDEQLLHRRLSVLPGEFSRDLAEAVVEPDRQSRTAPLLARLVHRSLLGASHGIGRTRFVQLAPVRAHAAHTLRAIGETELAERLRDTWTWSLMLSRPLAGRPEEAAWYATVTTELPTIRATLQRRLVQQPEQLGVEIAGQLPGFWYYLDLVEEGARWSEAAAAYATGRDFAGLRARLTLADLLAKQSRADRSRDLVTTALALVVPPDGRGFRLVDHDDRLGETEERWLAELLLSVAASTSILREPLTMRAATDLVGASGLLTDSPDLAVAHAALIRMIEVIERNGDVPLDAVEDVFRRADELGNLWAAWMAGAVGASVGLTRRDPRLGLRWSRRVIDRQGRLGSRTVVSQVETYGDFLAMDDRFVDAVRIFAATHHQSRRVGRTWPRNPVTHEMMERCRAGLSIAAFRDAWAIGPTLSREELTRPG